MNENINWTHESALPKDLGLEFLKLEDFHVYSSITHGEGKYPGLKGWLNLRNTKSILEESINGNDEYFDCRTGSFFKSSYQFGIINGKFLINSDDGLTSELETQLSSPIESSSDASDSDSETENYKGNIEAGFTEPRGLGANVHSGSIRDAHSDVLGQGDVEDIPGFQHSSPKHGQISCEPKSMGDIMGFQNNYQDCLKLCDLFEHHVSLKPAEECAEKNAALAVAPTKRLDPTETRPLHYMESSSSEDEDETPDSYKGRLQRSTSLKTGKTPPGTPGRKKIVRFADALGLDLARVRTFLDGIPNVPSSAYRDLNTEDLIDKANRSVSQKSSNSVPSSSLSLVANFTIASNLPGFIEKLKYQKVCLEHAAMVENMTIRGVVRCLNIEFHKTVIIRFTTDGWKTFRDISAVYVVNSCDGLSDKFSFSLYNHSLQPGEQVALAVCYRVSGQEFWDNNNGDNFVFQCITVSVPRATRLETLQL